MDAFCNEAGAICCKNVLFIGKQSPCISQDVKKTWLTSGFAKIFKNYAPLYAFFELCSFASTYNKIYNYSNAFVSYEGIFKP